MRQTNGGLNTPNARCITREHPTRTLQEKVESEAGFG